MNHLCCSHLISMTIIPQTHLVTQSQIHRWSFLGCHPSKLSYIVISIIFLHTPHFSWNLDTVHACPKKETRKIDWSKYLWQLIHIDAYVQSIMIINCNYLCYIVCNVYLQFLTGPFMRRTCGSFSRGHPLNR